MALIIVRRLDENVKRKLKQRAAARGVSMEEEVRTILSASVDVPHARTEAKGLGSTATEIMRQHGVELQSGEIRRTFTEASVPKAFEE